MEQGVFHRYYDERRCQRSKVYLIFALLMVIISYGIVRYAEAGTIQGRALDPLGQPISGATIEVGIDWGSSTPPCRVSIKGSNKTSSEGSYSVSVEAPCFFDPRPFTITISKKGYIFFPPSQSGTINTSPTILVLNFDGTDLNNQLHITRLLKNSKCVSNSSNVRIPLIAIHGIHGTSTENNLKIENDYWKDFSTFFCSSILSIYFDLYTFQYYSDLLSVQSLAKGLDFWLDNQGVKNTQKVLLAHSMGGLVAWSYMNELGGNATTMGLITLGTPFHGTPAANDTARGDLASTISSNPGVEISYDAADVGFWGFALADSPEVPNRSDLRYDSYDCLLPKYQGKEVNTWLRTINMIDGCGQKSVPTAAKIIAYAGYISFDDPDRPPTINQSLADAIKTEFSSYLFGRDVSHRFLAIGDALLGLGLGISLNDGLVPLDSAWFYGQIPATNRRTFSNCDHVELRMDTNGTRGTTEICRDSQGHSIFERLAEDLRQIVGVADHSNLCGTGGQLDQNWDGTLSACVLAPNGAGLISLNQPAGQEFMPTKSLLSAVELFLPAFNLPYSDTITVNIRSGTIVGPILGTTSLSIVSNIEEIDSCHRFTFMEPLPLTPGNVYVIETISTNYSFGWEYQQSNWVAACDYPGGDSIIQGSVNPILDWRFRTYAPSP
jgi:pimeloyl-ACP methyl ester carboxylesterase